MTAPPTPVTKGDWNCDLSVTPARARNVACAGFGASCANVAGFTGDPPCGTAGAYITCKANGLACEAASTVMVVQGCR